MRSPILLPLLLLPFSISALQVPSIFADFLDSIAGNDTAPQHELLKRDGNCPANFNSCSTLAKADGGACCTSGSICTRDRARNIACCPLGATCTGTVTLGTGTATGGYVLGGTTATTTSNSAATTAAAATGPVSVVSNAYFPFPYIPTSYANSAACNSAFSACAANFAACTADLQGAAFGVTVVAPNGAGVTVAPTVQNLGSASASSICNSLSGVGCYGLQSSNCAQFGGATSTGAFVVATGTNGGVGRSMVTVGPLLVAMGAGVGLIGMV